MISFKTKEDMLPSVLIILSIIVVVGVLGYSVLFPVSDAKTVVRSASQQQDALMKQIEAEKRAADGARASIATRLWKGDANHVGADVLALVTSSTSTNQVKLSAFRPQKQVDLSGIIELPYSITLVGAYKGVRTVMRDLDSKHSNVVLRSVQVNSSEEVAGTVTATLGISAYITADPLIAANIPKGGPNNAAVHKEK